MEFLDKIFHSGEEKPASDEDEGIDEGGEGIRCKPEKLEGKKIIINQDGVVLTNKERKETMEERDKGK